MGPLDLADALRKRQELTVNSILDRNVGKTVSTMKAQVPFAGPSVANSRVRHVDDHYLNEVARRLRVETMKTATGRFQDWIREDGDLAAALVVDNLPSWVDYSNALEDAIQSTQGNLLTVQGKNMLAIGKRTASGVRALATGLTKDPTGLRYKLDAYTNIMRGGDVDLSNLPRTPLGFSIEGDVRGFMALSPEEQQAQLDVLSSEILKREGVQEEIRQVFQRYQREQYANNFGRAQDLRDIDDLYSFVEWTANAGSNVAATAGAIYFAGLLGGAAFGAKGAMGAAGLLSATLETADIAGTLAEQGNLNRYTALRALAFGTLSGSVEMVAGAPAMFLRGTGGTLFRESMGQRMFRRLGRVWVRGATEEMAQEALQTYLQQLGVGGMEALVPDKEAIWEIINGAAMGAMGGGMLSGIGSVRYSLQARQDMKEALKAQSFENTMTKVADAVQSIPDTGKTPEVVQDITEALGGGDQQLFYQAEDLASFASENEIPLPDLLRRLAIAEKDFASAMDEGSSVAVTLDRVVGQGMMFEAGPEFFVQNGRSGDMAFTPAQVRDLSKRMQALREEIQQQVADEELSPQRSEVYEYIKDQVLRVGKSEQEAHALGVTWTAFFDTLAHRTNKPVAGLLQQYGIKFERGTVDTAPAGLQQAGVVIRSPGPNDAWTESKRLAAARMAEVADSGTAGSKGLTGPATAYTRSINLPVAMISDIPGAMDETPGPGQQKFDDLTARVEAEGFRTDSPILIGVNYLGEPYVIEGNNRLAVAAAQGVETIPAEVKWYSGGDEISGSFTPDMVEEMVGGQTLFQSAAALQGEPLNLVGTGAHGRVLKWDLATALTERHMQEHGRVLDPINNPEDFDIIVQGFVEDYRNQAQEADDGNGWYTADIQQALEITRKYLPSIKDPARRDLFVVLAALTSVKEKPVPNWEKASDAMEQYVRDGVMPLRKQNGKQFGVQNVGTSIQLLQHLITKYGEAGAVRWLTTEKTGREMAQERQESGLFAPKDRLAQYTPNEVNLSTVDLGINIFGPKVSDFFLNSSGIDQNAVTVDTWNVQTYRRHIGGLLDVPPAEAGRKEVASQPKGKPERDVIKELTRAAAAEVGIEPSAMQAALWYFEQRLERSHGINAVSQNFKQAAAAAAAKRGYEAEPALRETPRSGTVSSEPRTLYQRGITPDVPPVRGGRAVEGAAAVADVAGADTGLADQQDGYPGDQAVTEADLDRIDDPAFLPEFLARPGWGVVTASTALPDTEFYRNQRETNPALYELSVERQQRRNEEQNAYFLSMLEARGIPYIPMQGVYMGEPDGVSYLILSDEATVMAFGRQFNQDSVLTRDGLIFTNRPRPDVPVTGDVLVGEEALAEDFYSVTPSGTQFSMGLGFDVGGPGVPVIPEGYTESPDRPQLPLRPDGLVELLHWSDLELTEVDPAFAGTGPLKGEERQRGARLSFFGINPRDDERSQGTGYVKEGGLGPNLHAAFVDPADLYPIFEDPDGIAAGKDISEAEAAIREAGYLGYYTTDDGSTRAPLGNVAALFDAVPVQRVAPEEGRTLFQPAWHGSPHIFDTFDIGKIGTGEGAQVFGWGLYAADRRATADYYRPRGQKRITVNGQEVSQSYKHRAEAKEVIDTLEVSARAKSMLYGAISADLDVTSFIRGTAAGKLLTSISGAVNSRGEENMKAAQELVQELDAGRLSIDKHGRTYRVDVPEDSELLMWDAPFNDQPDGVRTALIALLNSSVELGDIIPSMTVSGRERLNIDVVNEAEAASKRSRDEGIAQLYRDVADHVRSQGSSLEWATDPSSEADIQARTVSIGLAKDSHIFARTWEFIQDKDREIDVTGSELYASLSQVLGGDKAASLALNAAGIPGHRFLDGGSRAKGEGSYNYVLYTDEAISILDFEQRQPSGVQGQIEFPAGGLIPGSETVIRLFNVENPSTLLHESGHFFFEMYRTLASAPAADPQIIDMWNKVNKGLGREENDFSELSTADHETLARSFEAWFLKGKAPSVGLRGVFRQFKQWLTRIYQTVQSMRGFEINSDIEDFMERMLATEEEIQLAKMDTELGPLFAERPVGMSDEAWRAYRETTAKEEEEAEERLIKTVMKSLRSKHRGEVADIAAARRAELTQTPAYQTLDKVTHEPRKEMRLNKKQLIELVGEDVVDRINEMDAGGKYKFAVPGGGDIYDVAELLGYRDPGVMVNDIVKLMDDWNAAEGAAEEDHKQLFGDALSDATLRGEAVAALHNDAKTRRLSIEMEAIKAELEAEGETVPDAVSLADMRAEAKRRFSEKKTIIARKPDFFLREERKQARIARESLGRVVRRGQEGTRLKGSPVSDLRAAYVALQRAALNHLYYIEAKKVEALISKMNRREKKVRKAYRAKKFLEPYGDHLTNLYEMFGFTKMAAGQPPGTVVLKDVMEAELSRTDGLDRSAELNPPESIASKSKYQHYNTLTVSELNDLYKAAVNLEKVAREEMKILREGHEMSYQAIRADLAATLATFQDKEFAISETSKEQRERSLSAMANSLKTVDTLLSELDRYNIGSFQKQIAIPVKQALARFTVRDKQAREDVAGIFKQWLEGVDLNEKIKVDELGGQVISKTELIAMAQNAGNRQNWQRLISDKRFGNFGEDSDARGDAIEAALNTHLSENEWHYVQDMWAYINTYWAEIAALERRLTGVTPDKIESEIMIRGAPAFVTGGYYPIYYDPRLSTSVTEYDLNDTLKNMRSGKASRAQTKNGHTKARLDSVDKELQLDIRIPMRHVSSVLFDLEMREPVAVTHRLLNDQQLASMFDSKGLKPTRQALILWIQDVANADRSGAQGVDKFIRHLRGGLSIAKMGLSWSTVVQQPLGLIQTGTVVGWKYTANAVGKYLANGMGHNSAVAQGLSNVMKERQETLERDVQWMVNRLDTDPVLSKWNRFRKFAAVAAFIGMAKVQYWTVDVPTWMAAYDRALAEGHMGQEAVAVADIYLERSQGSGALASRTAIERGTISSTQRDSEFWRLTTTFGSFMMSGKFNSALQKVGQLKQDPSAANIAKTAIDLIMMYAGETAAALFLTGRWPDEDEMEDWEDWGGIWGFMLAESASTVASGVPILRDAPSIMEGYGGGGTFSAAEEAIFGQLVDGTKGLVGIWSGINDNEDIYKQSVKDLLSGTGVALHLPTIQVNRILDALYEEDFTFRNDFSPYDLLTGRRD